jgi:hypothetical protein
MRRLAVVMMAVAVVLFAAGLSAQTTPSFAGKWTLQVDPSAAPPAGGGGGGRGGGGRGGGGGAFSCGQECTITQDATTLTISTTNQQGTTTTRKIMLDGTDSKIEMPGRGGAAGTTETAKAMWDGTKLVVSMTRTMNMGGNEMTITSKQTISLDASGMLVVENSTDMGQGPQTTKQTYKKG